MSSHLKSKLFTEQGFRRFYQPHVKNSNTDFAIRNSLAKNKIGTSLEIAGAQLALFEQYLNNISTDINWAA